VSPWVVVTHIIPYTINYINNKKLNFTGWIYANYPPAELINVIIAASFDD